MAMKCPKCDSVMIQLLSSWVCDACSTPTEQRQEKEVFSSSAPPICRMITIGDIDFRDIGGFEIGIPNYAGVFTFTKSETLELYEFIQLNVTNQFKTLHCTQSINISHVMNNVGERGLTINVPGYISRDFNYEQYQKLLIFMQPFVRKHRKIK